MRKFLSSPLTWMVAAELIVVVALVAVAWTMVISASRPALAFPALQPPSTSGDASGDATDPLPGLPVVTQPRGPLPGLNLDSSFWRSRLAEVNRDQVLLAQLEWRIVHNAMDAIKRYLERVVLPAVQRAEKGT